MKNSKSIFKTEQKLRKKVSGLQDVLPEFGSHLICIHLGKINQIEVDFSFTVQKQNQTMPFFNHGNLGSSLSPFLKTCLLRTYCSLGNLFNKIISD